MILRYRRQWWGDWHLHTWWLFGIIPVFAIPVDESEFDGDARDGN